MGRVLAPIDYGKREREKVTFSQGEKDGGPKPPINHPLINSTSNYVIVVMRSVEEPVVIKSVLHLNLVFL
jgi:hypothetical protein